ncbi:MAG: T9SS type A sorting domain-containing protein [Bacteroidia bacterium]
MKTTFIAQLTIVCFCLYFCALTSYAQCPDDDVVFRDQADIDAFKTQYPNCKNLKENLFITSSDDIVDLSGLTQIRTIRLQLFIRGNDALISLNGLDSLFQIGTELVIENNPVLQSLQGLGNLKTVGSDCMIESNPVLSSLQGLDALESIGGNLWLFGDDALSDLSGLGSLQDIGESLLVKSNKNLRDFSGIGALDSLGGSLDIADNPELIDFTGLESLRQIDEFLMLIENPKLFNMQGLNGLASIGRRLALLNSHSIQSFSGLDNLTQIGDGLLIWRNQQLKNCLGLEALEEIGGYGLSISNNENLNQLSGFTSLREINFLTIETCPQLIDLQGFESLIRINGGLQIQNNQNLESFRGLEYLLSGSLNNFLAITQNPTLSDISSLERIIQTDTISIQYNPSLSQCEIQTVCNQLEKMPDAVAISNNLAGCNTQAEVLLACAQKPDPVQFEFRLFPNPSRGTLFLEINSELLTITQVDLIDMQGKILSRTSTIPDYFDLSALNIGLYCLILYTEDGRTIQEKILLE